MRTSRQAGRASRQMLKLSFTNGKLDQQKVSRMVQTVLSEKPRHYAEVLKSYQRLVRLEVERRHVVVESAIALNPQVKDQVLTRLKARYGDDLTTEFRTNATLLGGLRIKVGDDVWDGSVRHRLNALGQPIDGKGPIRSETTYPLEKIAPGIIKRRPVGVPVQTGILPIDAMIPIGRGQRELIIGDRATGKTTVALDTIISQARLNRAAEEGKAKYHTPLYCIYVGFGQKNMNIARACDVLDKTGALPYTIVVSAAASDSATDQDLVPYAGAATDTRCMEQGRDQWTG